MGSTCDANAMVLTPNIPIRLCTILPVFQSRRRQHIKKTSMKDRHRAARNKARNFRTVAALAVLVGMLAGCGTSDDGFSRALTAPGKYHVNDCEQLTNINASLEARINNLEKLAARAKEGPGGGLVSALSYEPDIFAARGDIAELQRERVSKDCAPPADKK